MFFSRDAYGMVRQGITGLPTGRPLLFVGALHSSDHVRISLLLVASCFASSRPCIACCPFPCLATSMHHHLPTAMFATLGVYAVSSGTPATSCGRTASAWRAVDCPRAAMRKWVLRAAAGNHQTYALDLGFLVEGLLREARILPRGLAHPIIFEGATCIRLMDLWFHPSCRRDDSSSCQAMSRTPSRTSADAAVCC